MRVYACFAVLACAAAPSVARADDDDDDDDEDRGEPLPEGPAPAAEAAPDDGSRLVLDPMFLPPPLEGLGAADAEHQGVTLRLGSRTAARLEGAWWQNEDGGMSGTRFRDAAIDVPSLGWRASAELVHDFGFAELVVGASLTGLETRAGSRYLGGKYLTTGVALRKKWKLSRWTSLWLQLGAGIQSWMGEPPPGQKNATIFGLSLGGTFR